MPAALVERRNRVVIERLAPEIDGGRFASKRVVGEIVRVEADVLADGHELVACHVLHWHADNAVQPSPMKALGNDRLAGEFSVTKLGQHYYPVEGWVDHLENSEKYELKHRDLNSPQSLKGPITRVNQIRRENPALQTNRNLRFHSTDNPVLICYSKATDDQTNAIVVIVNLDCFHVQSGWIELDLESLGLTSKRSFQVHDLLGGGRYLWHGPRNYVELTPQIMPAHILYVKRWIRTERDFDYYL